LQNFGTFGNISSMGAILSWLQIIFSITLVIVIMLQKSDAGIGSAFGAGNDGGVTYHKRRGFEKVLFYLTIVFAVLLVVSLIMGIILTK
jgi:protein translocase SecG subunit